MRKVYVQISRPAQNDADEIKSGGEGISSVAWKMRWPRIRLCVSGVIAIAPPQMGRAPVALVVLRSA